LGLGHRMEQQRRPVPVGVSDLDPRLTWFCGLVGGVVGPTVVTGRRRGGLVVEYRSPEPCEVERIAAVNGDLDALRHNHTVDTSARSATALLRLLCRAA